MKTIEKINKTTIISLLIVLTIGLTPLQSLAHKSVEGRSTITALHILQSDSTDQLELLVGIFITKSKKLLACLPDQTRALVENEFDKIDDAMINGVIDPMEALDQLFEWMDWVVLHGDCGESIKQKVSTLVQTIFGEIIV